MTLTPVPAAPSPNVHVGTPMLDQASVAVVESVTGLPANAAPVTFVPASTGAAAS